MVADEASPQTSEPKIRQSLAQQDFHGAFEALLRLYSQKVFHLGLSMLRDHTQAEDITQEVFLRVWKGLSGYNGSASLSTWIYTIARNTCLTELNKRSARPTVSLDGTEFAGALDRLPALQAGAPESGMRMDVQQLLSRLPEKYHQVITLFYLEQKSYEEVGALLGLPLGTVKTLLYRARKQLTSTSRRMAPVAA